jgi:hypothetical protein
MKSPLTTGAARSKQIAAMLKKSRAERYGLSGDSSHLSRRRRPNEDTEKRNQRIIDRFIELRAAHGGKLRGIQTQLAFEFMVSRQYIARDVINPYIKAERPTLRK